MLSQRALVYGTGDQSLSVETVEIPRAIPGSAVVRIRATTVSPNALHVYSQSFGGFPIPAPPFTPSAPAVGHIHELGPDATTLSVGQLVFVHTHIHARDDPDTSMLQGYIGTPTSAGNILQCEAAGWCHGTFAEYARVPLENVYLLDEDLLTGQLGYSIVDLTDFTAAFTNAGGLLDDCGGPGSLDVHAGDTVIVAPATGHFGGAGVRVALALGARVIAVGRNQESLDSLAQFDKATSPSPGLDRLRTVKLSGDVDADTVAIKSAASSFGAASGNYGKGADKYIDWSPPQAQSSTHIQSCIKALKPGGRMVLMGGIQGNIEIPYFHILRNSIRIQGRLMSERGHILQVIKLVEAGLLVIGGGGKGGKGIKMHNEFSLDNFHEAFEAAAEQGGWGCQVVLEP